MSGVGYTKSRPIRRHRHRHRPRGISMYKVSIIYLNQQRQLYKIRQIHQHQPREISVYNVTVRYLNQWHWLYKKLANTSASASGNISIQCHHSLFKSVALAIQKVGQYVGIGIGIGLGEYQCTRFLLVIQISSISYTKSWPISRHRPRGISVYNVTVCYLNEWCWLYKKSANTSASASASASGNINVQCFRLLFKSAALAIQKIGQYVGIGLGKYQYTMSPFVI